jgi:cardiolipin synthase
MSAASHLLLSHVLSIVGFAMGALLVTTIVTQRRAPGTTFAWLLAIVLIPYVGVPLYLAIGGRKLRARATPKPRLYAPRAVVEVPRGSIAGMLCASGAPLPHAGNSMELHVTGELAFAALMETLRSAEKSIHISTLIVGDDATGNAILAVLEDKARAGLEVRLLIDAMFKFRANKKQLGELERAGGKLAWFMPVWHVPFRSRTNLRLHRKIIVVDGRAAIIGGMNLAHEYMGPTPAKDRWRDLSAKLVGPAVDDLDTVFRADWSFAAGEDLATAACSQPSGEAAIQVIGSGPDVAADLIYDAFLSAVFEARTRLWISTPYFVPDEALARGLALAVRRGVDVRVIVPARSNHLSADLAGASYLRDLDRAGAKICCYAPGMLHAKSILVDDTLAVLGSANFDMRSLFLNYEISSFFTSPAEIATIAAWFDSTWPMCKPLVPAARFRRLVESVFRLVGPLE